MLCRNWGTWLLLSCAGIVGCGNGAAPAPGPKIVEVLVSAPITRDVVEFEDFTGRTESQHAVTMRSRVTGYLDKALFKEGAEVKAGDVLFQIDPQPYEAQVHLGEAEVASNVARLALANQNYQRGLVLEQTKGISQQELDQYKAARDQALAQLNASRATLDIYRLNLQYTRVTAPIDGLASRQLIDPGNLVTANVTALTTIVALDPIYAYFDVDERTVLRLRRLHQEGKIDSYQDAPMPVLVSLADEQQYSVRGTVDFVDNVIDVKTGTQRLRAVIDNRRRLLAPGMFVRVRLPVGVPHAALLVAEKALGTDQGQKFLYVVNERNEVEYRSVKVGILDEGLRVIASGLRRDERVVVSGLQRVRPGSKVEPRAAVADNRTRTASALTLSLSRPGKADKKATAGLGAE